MIVLGYLAATGGTLIAFLLTFLAAYPVFHFLALGWQIKKEDVFSSLGRGAKKVYLETFLNRRIDGGDIDGEFERIYRKRYGTRQYFLPLLLLVLFCFLTTLFIANTAAVQLIVHYGGLTSNLGDIGPKIVPVLVIPAVAALALTGAYVWVVIELGFCARRNDLVPSDILRATIRLILAIPLAYSVVSLFSPAIAPFLALALGAFPLAETTAIIRTLGYQQLKLNEIREDAKNALTNLDGVDRTISNRLQDEGISTVLQLAYCDPVQLSIRSALSFDVVIDLVSQALAWNYLHDKLKQLSILGLRGSIEFWNILDELDDGDPEERKKAATVFSQAAEIVGLDVLTFRNLCQEIANDPYNLFLTKVLEFIEERRAQEEET